MAKKWSEIKHKCTPEQREASLAEARVLSEKLRAHELHKQLRIARKMLREEMSADLGLNSTENGTILKVAPVPEVWPEESKAA